MTFETLVAAFGEKCAKKLAGPGDQEAAIRSPLESLIEGVGALTQVEAVMHDEVRDAERRVRPDYAVKVDEAVIGYIEVKAPQHTIDPDKFTGHDKQQWERQKDLPNLIYTNGTQWRLYRDGKPVGSPVTLSDQPLETLGKTLPALPALESMLTDFLRWEAAPITSVRALVRAITPLTRLLRGEVVDQLAAEDRAIAAGAPSDDQPFRGLASDWRKLLFPDAKDETFADGYAQTVTFALLLARTREIDLTGRSLHEIGKDLSQAHSLMGRALQLLTDDVAADFKVSLDLLVRVVGAVHWQRIRAGKRDVYLYLYEQFLAAYDPAKRRASGTYYTPQEVSDEMVRLVEEALQQHVGLPAGYRDDTVTIVDPALGTGSFMASVIERVRAAIEDESGHGAVPGALTDLARRLIGFEIQMGPYAVAQLRMTELLTGLDAELPATGLQLYVTDTLDDPDAAETQLGSGLAHIAKARKAANQIKASQPVTVVLGNPPYRELVAGAGGWVEHGSDSKTDKHASGILETFTKGVPGRLSAKLKNLYIYFYRWATWKVWESTPADRAGVVCFITTAGYLTGPAFTAMRSYLRRESSAGWIIDLSPEGQRSDVRTRVFPGVAQPLVIGLFVRTDNNDATVPANLLYTSLHGPRAVKFTELGTLTIDDPTRWQPIRTEWTAAFTPAPATDWDNWPAVSDLMPWYRPGVFPTRTWVYGPSPVTLQRRWAQLTATKVTADKNKIMKAGPHTNATKGSPELPGKDVATGTTTPLERENRTTTATVPVAYRAFDRQHLIADPRVIHRPARDLWAARQTGQVFVSELHTKKLSSGPGLVFSHLLPDFHHFKGSEGGRILPWLHPTAEPNLVKGLTEVLSAALRITVAAPNVLAYLAAITSHPGYTAQFSAELGTPGVRIPITEDPALWQQAVALGTEVLWSQTYGQAFSGSGRPAGDIRYPSGHPRRIICQAAIQGLPDAYRYNSGTKSLELGTGRFGPVAPAVIDYQVGGRNVIKSWVGYRKQNPAGKRSTALDAINPDAWEHAWTNELIELLTVLDRVTQLEFRQNELLHKIIGGSLLPKDTLGDQGVQWPGPGKSAAPRYPTTMPALLP